jgi:3-hydroxyacyl-[acyl-carrier-protein] dehydratase
VSAPALPTAGRVLSPREVLERLPQRDPFRFLDEILAVDGECIEAAYRWREDADFYRGHFPGDPITPGVLLVESMAQAGVVALGIYIFHRDEPPEVVERLRAVFTDAQVEFSGIVRPGERVRIRGRKLFCRRRKIRSQVEMLREDGSVVCSGELAGIGVLR